MILTISILSTGLVFAERNFFQLKAQHLGDSLSSQDYLKENVLKTINLSDKLENLKPGLIELFDELDQRGFVVKQLDDQIVRPYFVSLQGIIEQNLAYALQKGTIKNVVGLIHTPMPATPLCTQGDISEKLVDSSLLQDEQRLFTVRARANIIRDFLDLGGFLYVVYPQGGLGARTVEQQNVYKALLQKYQGKLFDYELKTISSMDPDLVGASYLFEDCEGDFYLFSIQAYQANAPTNEGTWSMWYGKTSNPKIAARLARLREFLREHHGPDFNLNTKLN